MTKGRVDNKRLIEHSVEMWRIKYKKWVVFVFWVFSEPFSALEGPVQLDVAFEQRSHDTELHHRASRFGFGHSANVRIEVTVNHRLVLIAMFYHVVDAILSYLSKMILGVIQLLWDYAEQIGWIARRVLAVQTQWIEVFVKGIWRWPASGRKWAAETYGRHVSLSTVYNYTQPAGTMKHRLKYCQAQALHRYPVYLENMPWISIVTYLLNYSHKLRLQTAVFFQLRSERRKQNTIQLKSNSF